MPTAHDNAVTLSVLVENKAGVLARVSGLFARRGYNIISLAVAPTEDEAFSRITIVYDARSATVEQVVKQLFKLINVIRIDELEEKQAIERELLLATVRAEGNNRGRLMELVQIFEGKPTTDQVGIEIVLIQNPLWIILVSVNAPEKLDECSGIRLKL